ncbi:MAG: transposase, partial [Alphaproteobacteria bacterium]|nr:transposase [Alphaproteobacteria bacterium]
MNLKTNEGTLSTYSNMLKGLTHLEELSKRIDWLESQSFKKPLIHII